MTDATLLWSVWQGLLQAFAWTCTRPGFRRFAEWVTALALNVEEHTITQSVLASERPADWKAMERFAEYGAWRAGSVTNALTRLVEKAPGRLWHGYHVSAVDDTKSATVSGPGSPRPRAAPSHSGPRANWPSNSCESRPESLAAVTWQSSTVAMPSRA